MPCSRLQYPGGFWRHLWSLAVDSILYSRYSDFKTSWYFNVWDFFKCCWLSSQVLNNQLFVSSFVYLFYFIERVKLWCIFVYFQIHFKCIFFNQANIGGINFQNTMFSYKLFYWNFGTLVPGVHDTPHAHKSHAIHIAEALVLSRPEVRHPAFVVGLLIEEPVAVHHMTGLAVRHAVTVHDTVTVIHHLVHLTHEVLPLVYPHSVGSPVL